MIMNTGVISARYAKALLKLTRQTGRGEQVALQVKAFLDNPQSVTTARLEPDLEKFLALLVKKDRMEYVKFIFRSFLRLYCESAGIKPVKLTLACPCDGVDRKIAQMVQRVTGCRVPMTVVLDPEVIGGFKIEIDDYIMDATVKRQLEDISREFIEKNRRIV